MYDFIYKKVWEGMKPPYEKRRFFLEGHTPKDQYRMLPHYKIS